jgi:hypothetical protein
MDNLKEQVAANDLQLKKAGLIGFAAFCFGINEDVIHPRIFYHELRKLIILRIMKRFGLLCWNASQQMNPKSDFRLVKLCSI